ncbi:FAD:protein FMN transferase [Paracoccus niistensis]|uniref:FAD:protein FMN transferase n=1 Tax=Paracoccus niistensis TaxID=632935 RepID=A0ABV6I6G8_9RHOB
MILPRRRFLALSACALASPSAAAPARHHWRGVALGADVALTVEGGTPAAARAFFAESERALRLVERRFSLFGGSELMRLNALGRLAHPSDDMLALLDLAGRVNAATGGAFDPTVQPLWQARRLGQDESPARALVGWEGVRADAAEIRLARPGMALTLNGIAQGFAADRLAEVAAHHRLGDLLIDAGEVRALGASGWQARIETPDGGLVRELTLRGRALATSAPFGTRIGPAGDRAHILGPQGQPPRWALVSVSADSAALADALSTAAVLMERPAIDAALRSFPKARLEALVSL